MVSAPATWNPAYAERLLYANFAEVELDLAAAGATGLSVIASGAQRGNIRTGAGGDTVTWVAHAAPGVAGGPDTVMTISTGAGHDSVVVTAAGRSDIDQPFGWGGAWRGDYDGRASVARISLGAGDDWATLAAGGGAVDGGAGTDTVVLGGASSRYAVTALADGSTRIDDRTGAQGGSVLWGVKRLRFTDGEIAAPGQAPAPTAIDIAPVAATPVLPLAAPAASASGADWQI